MPIEHVVLLCLENRSFDHMLGFLEHPDPTFEGVRSGNWSNKGADGAPVPPTPHAKTVLPYGPDHDHDSVMRQIALKGLPGRQKATNQGFLTSYERTVSGRARPSYSGPIGWLRQLLARRSPPSATGRGPLVMLCQDPAQVPVLSTLALEFAVCDHWYCSVPGETWPNRNFLHAATSDGETNVSSRLYDDRTIFELLEDAGHRWRIYHDGIPQVWAFRKLWDEPQRHGNWFDMEHFYEHVRRGDLATYSFIEPNHTPPLHPVDQLQAMGAPTGHGNSQHPENNLVDNAAYDDFAPGPDTDFVRGERLIASVYEALRGNPELFERTVLVITYDEHGGFYDHLAAADLVKAPGDPRSSLGRVVDRLYTERARRFGFTRLGVRVPTVVVSPLVPAGKVEHSVLEHASVPATLRAFFAPDQPPLTKRDAAAHTFHHLWQGNDVRTDLPDLSEYVDPPAAAPPHTTAPATPKPPRVPSYYEDFLAQAEDVRDHLLGVREPEAAHLDNTTSLHDGDALSAAFDEAAHRHRHAQIGPTGG